MGKEDSEVKKLYIRLPAKITDKLVIKQLHPNIVQVHLPRQKTRRWCIVDFENSEKLKEAAADLKKQKIDNRAIKIKPYKQGSKQKKEEKRSQQTTESLEKLIKLE